MALDFEVPESPSLPLEDFRLKYTTPLVTFIPVGELGTEVEDHVRGMKLFVEPMISGQFISTAF